MISEVLTTHEKFFIGDFRPLYSPSSFHTLSAFTSTELFLLLRLQLWKEQQERLWKEW